MSPMTETERQEVESGAGGEAAAAADVPSEAPWRPSPHQVHQYKDAEAIAEAAAKRVLDSAKRAVDKNDRFVLVLAGGSTPRALYRRLTESPYREKLPWRKTYFVFGDERCVPPDDEQSNFRMVSETLLDPLEIAPHQVLRMKGEQKPAEAARRYEVRLGDLFLNRSNRHFDLVLLGVGADGHTASLFPGTAALDETERWVVANEVPQLEAWRLTLTFKALDSARRVLFLATGEEKARVVAEAFGGVEHETVHPCERVRPLHARREVLVDHAAGALMPAAADSDGEAAGDSGS
jgi:6-phosphogluconolactonase